jgi:hypothetical protein
MADPWFAVTGPRRLSLLGRFLPSVLRHWIRRPYGAGRPPRPGGLWYRAQTTARSAVYDAVVNHILDGYAELARRPLRPETGALIILLYRLMAAFDDEYERRVRYGVGALDFAAVLGSPPVQVHLAALSAFLAPHEERHALRRFLERFAADSYERYRRLAASRGGVPDQLALVELDSAGQLVCTAHAIGIFNAHSPGDALVDEFAHLGIVGKLADLVDVWADRREGVANLFAAVVATHPDEHAAYLAHAEREPRPGHRFWRSTCPTSFAEYTAIVAAHRAALTAPSLRSAADLMLLPAALGGPATRAPASDRDRP